MESVHAVGNVTARAFKGWSGSAHGRRQETPAKVHSFLQCVEKAVMQKPVPQRLLRRVSVIRSQAARDDKAGVAGEPFQKARPMGVHGGFNSTLATGRKASGTQGSGNKVLLYPVEGVLSPEFGLFDNMVDSFTTDMDKRIACLERQFEQWEAVAKETMDILTIVRKRCAQQKLESRRSELEVGLKADLGAAAVHPLEAIFGTSEHGSSMSIAGEAVKGLSMNPVVAAASGLKADARGTADSIQSNVDEVVVHTDSLASTLTRVAKTVGKQVKASKAKCSIADELVDAAMNSRPIRRARIQHKRMLKSTTRSTQKKGKLGWDGDLLIWSRV